MKENQKWRNHIDIKAFIDALPDASDDELLAVWKCCIRSLDHLPSKGQCCGQDGWNIISVIGEEAFSIRYNRSDRKKEQEALLASLTSDDLETLRGILNGNNKEFIWL